MSRAENAVRVSSSTVSVLLIEQQDQFESTEWFTRAAFREIGYEIAVRFVDASQLVIDSKKSNPLFSEAFDCIVSDISWGGEIESAQGLSAIRYFRRNWPDLLVIGCSRSQLTYPQVAIKQPSFHLFWYKPEFTSRKKYLPEVASQLRRAFNRNVNVSLEPSHSSESRGSGDREFDLELTGLLRQLTFTGHQVADAIGEVVLHSVSGGFSKSRVYRMEAKTISGAECVSTVVKISDPEGAARELANYQSYVKWGLPFKWRPELLGSAFTANYGAVCYSFVETAPSGFTSLGEAIVANDCKPVLEVIKSIFDPRQQQWYHNRNVKKHLADENSAGLTGYYRDRWFPDSSMIQSANAALKGFGKSVGIDFSRADSLSFEGRVIRMPEIALLGQIRFDYHTCVRHGDLHGGNIMVSPAGQSCFIDFQDTGRGHVFEDFVVFECSLRLYFNSGLAFAESFERERQLFVVGQNGVVGGTCHDAIQSCIEVRNRAKENFPSEKWANYVYALGLFCFRLLRINELMEWQRLQIVALMLACVDHFEK